MTVKTTTENMRKGVSLSNEQNTEGVMPYSVVSSKKSSWPELVRITSYSDDRTTDGTEDSC